MAKWARVVASEVVEVTTEDPAGRFHPSLAWVPCPNNVKPGWVVDGTNYTVPVIPLERVQKIMKDAIKGREEQRNSRRIEMDGSFFMYSPRIDKIIARADTLANADPIPTAGGTFDDVNDNPVALTVGQLKKLRNLFIDREEANITIRKAHIATMMESVNPLQYDYSNGWK